MASCFSCFMVKVLDKRFLCDDRCKGKNRLVPLRVMLRGRPTPLANAAIEIPSVITVDVIRLCPRCLQLY